MDNNELIQLKYDEIIQETDLAWLLRFGDDEVWMPKSRCENDDEERLISVPQWLIEEKGLEVYAD